MENSHTQQEIYIKVEKLEWVDSFRYLRITITKERNSEAEIKSRIAFVIAALVKFNRTWQDKNISSASKVKLRVIEYAIGPEHTWNVDSSGIDQMTHSGLYIQMAPNKSMNNIHCIRLTTLLKLIFLQ